MIAGYSDYAGYGNTPPGGIKGFEFAFKRGKNLNHEKSLTGIDALILWGGADISTSLYGREPFNSYQSSYVSDRDLFEWELLRLAYKRGIPIIGVCRGAQILCAFAGGALVQDMHGHLSDHEVVTYEGELFKSSSSHHQLMYPYKMHPDDYKILATVSKNQSHIYQGITNEEVTGYKDGKFLEAEVVEFPSVKGFGIQGHPEWTLGSDFNKWVEKEILARLFGEVK